MIYLDNAATAPLDPRVLEAMLPYLRERYGNPSSLHAAGREAKAALEAARETVARTLGASPGEIFFTSGGTEADNWALRGSVAARPDGRRIWIGATEHHAVLESGRLFAEKGISTETLPVDAQGRLDLQEASARIRPDGALVSVMLANNETGTLQPIPELASLCRKAGVPLHTDAVQAVGHMPIQVDALGVDLLSLSAHKMGGPKGVGALYVRKGTPLHPLLAGGQQERGLRGGTENLPGIVGLAKALDLAITEMEETNQRLWMLRRRLIAGIERSLPDAVFHGHPVETLPGIVNVSIPGVQNERLLMLLDLEGIAASAGAACAAGLPGPSHVLAAMGVSSELAQGAIRLSLGPQNTQEEIDQLLAVLPRLAERLRAL